VIQTLSFIVRIRWNVLRLLVACVLVWVLAADFGARTARMALSRLPGFDYASEIDALRLQGRYGEAQLLAEAGLADEDADQAAIQSELTKVITERDSILRKLRDAGKGALIGRGDTLESLIGALATDFFVIGDVRDLVIEGGRYVVDGESDELVIMLSVAGIVTTLAPEIDWVPALMKSARKAGHLSEKFGRALIDMVRADQASEVKAVVNTIRRVSDASSPGSAMRWLRFVESPKELDTIAQFVTRSKSAAAALHVTGESGANFLKSATNIDADTTTRAARVLEDAGRKGPAGTRFLQSGAANRLLRPHPLIGISKGVIKGNAARAIERFAEKIDPWGGTLLALGLAWLFVECALAWQHLSDYRRSRLCPT